MMKNIIKIIFALLVVINVDGVAQNTNKSCCAKKDNTSSNKCNINYMGFVSTNYNNQKNNNVVYLVNYDKREIVLSKSDIADLNPMVIESIQVLNSIQSLEKYGEKAKDGVIILTLKEYLIGILPNNLQAKLKGC